MKNLSKCLAIATVLTVCASKSFGQATASATASATIITPISIAKTADMDFGNVAVQTANAGTVKITPAGVRTATGGVTLPATAGTPSSASFTVTGQSTYTYSIILPSAPITITSGGNSMTVGTFLSNPVTTGLLTAGTQTLNVGATLFVGAGQAPGTYTSATPFDVTVNYN